MLDLMKDTKKEYVSRVFAIFDEDYDSRINFREFFVGCWNYCTISAVALPIFCFDLYDHDCSGEVELKEILIMLSEIYGQDGFENNKTVKQLVAELTAEAKKVHKNYTAANICLRIAEFDAFCKRHPLLLQPAHNVQTDLRKKVCGMRFWRKCSKRRVLIDVVQLATSAVYVVKSHGSESRPSK